MAKTRVSRPGTGRNITGSRTEPKPQLSDEQWFLIADLFPHPPIAPDGGRPRVHPRACLEGIIWVLRTGARWKDMPPHLPSPSTCWRRLQEWTAAGIFEQAWSRLLAQLDRRKLVVWSEAFGDGTFCPAKRGALMLVRPSEVRGPSSCSLSTVTVFHWPLTSPAPRPLKSS
jgi:transposase